MTAVGASFDQPSSPSPSQDARSQEPSMEDILASIRRIIADDQSQGGRFGGGGTRRTASPATGTAATADDPASQPSASQPSADLQDVLDLAEIPDIALRDGPGTRMAAPEPSIPAFPIERASFLETSDFASLDYGSAHDDANAPPSPSGKVESRLEGPEIPVAHGWGEEPLDQDVPDHSVTSVGAADPLISPMLGASVMSAFETLAATVVLQNNEMLERLMHELLRPLIKNWLEENLPTLVERLVRGEIERVARGGRR